MKIEELRIGNWIIYPHLVDGRVIEIAQVKGISISDDCKHSCVHVLIKQVMRSADIKEPKPIPLTEEWLIKFGFKKDLNGNAFYFKYYHEAGIFNISNKISSINRTGEWFLIELPIMARIGNQFQYVHQLQNLYFALTGEELEEVALINPKNLPQCFEGKGEIKV